MNLYFLRHAKACARGRKWVPDDTRPLTREGEKKMFDVARGIKSLGLGFNLILTSPYIRAFRTAEILGEVLESKRVVETKNLAADAPLEAVVEEVRKNYDSLEDIVFVGHEPFMSRLVSVLLTGEETLSIELRKAGLCKLSAKRLRFGACASLDWLMTPRQLARLARGKR